MLLLLLLLLAGLAQQLNKRAQNSIVVCVLQIHIPNICSVSCKHTKQQRSFPSPLPARTEVPPLQSSHVDVPIHAELHDSSEHEHSKDAEETASHSEDDIEEKEDVGHQVVEGAAWREGGGGGGAQALQSGAEELKNKQKSLNELKQHIYTTRTCKYRCDI